MPIHWNDCFASSARVGMLIAPVRDPVSGQPAFKQTAVSVTPIPVRWQALLIARDALPLPANDYWCRREVDGWQIHTLAGNARVTAADLKALWAPAVSQWAEFEDSEQEHQRLLGYAGGELLCWFVLAPDLPAIAAGADSALAVGKATRAGTNRARGRLCRGGRIPADPALAHTARDRPCGCARSWPGYLPGLYSIRGGPAAHNPDPMTQGIAMRYHRFPVTVLLLALAGNPAVADKGNADNGIAEALTGGETSLSFRLRHEQVRDDAFAADANASTLRTRLGYTSGQWRNLDLNLELDHVSQLFDRRFNDTRNGKTGFPVVADPKGADLNQASLRYRLGDHSAVAGRQRITLDNHRFIGSVGWRQNEQTYDALRLSLKPLPTLAVDYAWIDSTRRIFGPDSGNPPASLASDHQLLHLQWSGSEALNAGAYYYRLDFADAPALSSRTVGGLVRGEATAGELKLDYRLEAARQSDAGPNPVNYSADYSLVSAGVTTHGIRFGAALEVLGADRDAGVALQTPLATLHAFQGWSDKFLATPVAGIRDSYFSISGALEGVQLRAIWHQYRSDAGSVDLGEELNLQASRSFAGRYTLTAKYADYRADAFSSDTRKFWLVAEAKL